MICVIATFVIITFSFYRHALKLLANGSETFLDYNRMECEFDACVCVCVFGFKRLNSPNRQHFGYIVWYKLSTKPFN